MPAAIGVVERPLLGGGGVGAQIPLTPLDGFLEGGTVVQIAVPEFIEALKKLMFLVAKYRFR